ncbi:MAG: 2-oxoacid:acceptor oxidoreductase family protein [Thermodesulfovibrionales bacterium]
MKERTEILVSGFGGQGVVRLGQILGEAAMRQGLRVTMQKSHGTEQRGGYVRSQIVVSTSEVDSPVVEEPDYFLALSSAAYNAYRGLVREGIILYDPAYVDVDESMKVRQYPVPAKELAIEKLGRELFSNSVMLGALSSVAGLYERDNLLETLLSVIPKFKDENRKAFEIGASVLSGAAKGESGNGKARARKA